MLESRGEVTGLLRAIYRAYGRRAMRALDILDLLRRHLLSRGMREENADRELALLERSGCLCFDALTGRYRLSSRAADHTERMLFARIRRSAEVEVIPEQKLDAVTRRFVEEVLEEAHLPDELVDEIVRAYQIGGRIEMSEDGNRYVIRLALP